MDPMTPWVTTYGLGWRPLENGQELHPVSTCFGKFNPDKSKWELPNFDNHDDGLPVWYAALIVLHDVAAQGYEKIVTDDSTSPWFWAASVFAPEYGDKTDFIKTALRAVEADEPEETATGGEGDGAAPPLDAVDSKIVEVYQAWEKQKAYGKQVQRPSYRHVAKAIEKSPDLPDVEQMSHETVRQRALRLMDMGLIPRHSKKTKEHLRDPEHIADMQGEGKVQRRF
jgi:hypothetical protein